MRGKQFNELRKRAKKIHKECQQQKNTVFSQEVTQLIDELTLYQIELEIQNDDLIKSQAELEESHNKYIELYELAPIGYFSLNKDGLIKEVNEAGSHLLGLKKQSLINRCFSRYVVSEFQTLFSEFRRRAFTEMCLQSFEIKLLRWNQPSFHALIECKVVKNTRTRHAQLLAFVTDISSRKLAENTLHYQRIKMASIDRLRSLNEFIDGIAQDQNHVLTLINNYLHGCINRLEMRNFQIDELLQILKKVASQSSVLEEIIRNRIIFTSKTIFRYEDVNINTIISQTISLFSHETQDFPITIQYEAADNQARVKIDKFHIQQTLLNLARNAMEAMRDAKTQEPKLLIETSQTKQNILEVCLFDNGPGLLPELIPKLFEPHYTTKSYGIGLGLTVSRAIIEKHGGQLFARTNSAGGACFGFTLPVSSTFVSR